MALASSVIRQSAVLAFHEGKVCLVRSSSGKRWVLPKGHVEHGQSAGDAALQEAWEEAGLNGTLESEAVGTYRYEKRGLVCQVTLFVMHVTKVARTWPEEERTRAWVSLPVASSRLEHLGLKRLLRKVQIDRTAVTAI